MISKVLNIKEFQNLRNSFNLIANPGYCESFTCR